MPTPAKPEASDPAPEPTPAPPVISAPVTIEAAPRSRSDAAVAILAGVKDLMPSIALSVALALMVFFAVPKENHDPVLSIISGMLGFLTGRATAPRVQAGSPPAANDH